MIIDDVIKSAKRIHFIGIGGSGMCPLAEILHEKGYYLTGSDNNETDTLKRIIEKYQITENKIFSMV